MIMTFMKEVTLLIHQKFHVHLSRKLTANDLMHMTAAVEADVFMSYVATGNIWNPQKLRDTRRMTLLCTNMTYGA